MWLVAVMPMAIMAMWPHGAFRSIVYI
jgi:hypothetical protein